MLKKLLCAAALVLGNVVSAQAGPVLSVTPSPSNVTVGSLFMLDIRISGVSDLFGWELDVLFGPAGLLNASPATEGSFLGAGTIFGGGTVDNGAATVTTVFNSLTGTTGVSGGGILASISFEALMAGAATVSLSNILLIDSNLDSIPFSFPDDVLSATVNIAPRDGGTVPEPSTLALIGLALAGLSASRRQVASPVQSG